MTNTAAQTHQTLQHQARQYLDALTAALASGVLAQTPVLIQLQTRISEALDAYEQENQRVESFEQRLEQQAHLSWLCNQCKYYLSELHAIDKTPVKHRSLRQIRAVVGAIARFRLIVHLRSLFPGKAPTSLGWRDILPGFKLWLR